MTVHTVAIATQHVGDDARIDVTFHGDDRVIIRVSSPETFADVLDAHVSYAAAVELYERLDQVMSDLADCAGCDATIRVSTAYRADTGLPFIGASSYCSESCSERHAERVSTRAAGS